MLGLEVVGVVSTAMPISTGPCRGERPTMDRNSATMCTFVRRATPPVPGDTGRPVDVMVARMAPMVGLESRSRDCSARLLP